MSIETATVEEVLEAICAAGRTKYISDVESDEDWEGWEPWDYFWESREGLPMLETSLGSLYEIDQHGGEGQGDELWKVVTIGDRYFRKSGYYASWDGGSYDGEFEEVFPIQVTRREWTTSPE